MHDCRVVGAVSLQAPFLIHMQHGDLHVYTEGLGVIPSRAALSHAKISGLVQAPSRRDLGVAGTPVYRYRVTRT